MLLLTLPPNIFGPDGSIVRLLLLLLIPPPLTTNMLCRCSVTNIGVIITHTTTHIQGNKMRNEGTSIVKSGTLHVTS